VSETGESQGCRACRKVKWSDGLRAQGQERSPSARKRESEMDGRFCLCEIVVETVAPASALKTARVVVDKLLDERL